MDDKKLNDKKYGLIFGWTCFLLLAGWCLFWKWVSWSIWNDGFWAKYGDEVMKCLFIFGFIGAFIFLFISTIGYIKQSKAPKKGENK